MNEASSRDIKEVGTVRWCGSNTTFDPFRSCSVNHFLHGASVRQIRGDVLLQGLYDEDSLSLPLFPPHHKLQAFDDAFSFPRVQGQKDDDFRRDGSWYRIW